MVFGFMEIGRQMASALKKVSGNRDPLRLKEFQLNWVVNSWYDSKDHGQNVSDIIFQATRAEASGGAGGGNICRKLYFTCRIFVILQAHI